MLPVRDGKEGSMAIRGAENVHVINSLAIAKLSKNEFEAHRGEYAILVGGTICSYHKTNKEAVLEAHSKYKIGQFSVQRIETQPVDMGFVDCADYPR